MSWNIERFRGDTRPLKIQIVKKSDGTAVDITGYTFLMTADPSREPTDSANNIFQLNGVIIDASNGLVQFNPQVADVDYVGCYFHDIQMTTLSGDIDTVENGRFLLKQDITK